MTDNTTVYRFLVTSMGETFYILSFLSLLTIYLDKAPHNIAASLLLVFSAVILFKHKESTVNIIQRHKYYFSLSILFFITYSAINLYHFGWNEDLFYALKRVRWVIYILILVPAFCIISHRELVKYKLSPALLKFFFYSFFGLFSLIFLHELIKLGFISAPDSFTINTPFQNRASWIYNPVPFSKISFFGMIIMSFFMLKLKNNYEKFLACFQIIIMLSLTLLSQTRASWLGAVLAFLTLLFVLALQRKPRFCLITFCFGAVFVSALSFSPSLNKRVESIFTTDSFSNSYRIEHWKANVRLINDNIFLGVGENNNRKEEVIKPHLNVDKLKKYTSDKTRIFNGSHNEYLDIGSGGGIISLVLFLICFGYPVVLNITLLLKRQNFTLTLSLSYLVFMYFTLIFDKINYLNWPAVLTCWIVIFIYYDNEKPENSKSASML